MRFLTKPKRPTHDAIVLSVMRALFEFSMVNAQVRKKYDEDCWDAFHLLILEKSYKVLAIGSSVSGNTREVYNLKNLSVIENGESKKVGFIPTVARTIPIDRCDPVIGSMLKTASRMLSDGMDKGSVEPVMDEAMGVLFNAANLIFLGYHLADFCV